MGKAGKETEHAIHEETFTNLRCSRSEGLPIKSRQYVLEEAWVVFDVGLLELGILEMKWKRIGRAFACLDGTCEEIHGQYFHREICRREQEMMST